MVSGLIQYWQEQRRLMRGELTPEEKQQLQQQERERQYRIASSRASTTPTTPGYEYSSHGEGNATHWQVYFKHAHSPILSNFTDWRC
jgi:hypothetical protein